MCVFQQKKSVKVGDGAYNNMKSDKRRATKSWHVEASNTYIEFNAQWLQTLNMQVAIWNVILLRKNFPQKF